MHPDEMTYEQQMDRLRAFGLLPQPRPARGAKSNTRVWTVSPAPPTPPNRAQRRAALAATRRKGRA